MNPFENRKYFVIAIIIGVVFIFIIKLFYVQVVENEYKHSADNNSMRFVTQYPARGLVYDRNGILLVENQAAYDLMIIPKQVKEFDTLQLSRLLNISSEDIRVRIKKAKKQSYYKPSIFLKQISIEEFAVIQEKLYKFPGFYEQSRTLRKYPQRIGAHIYGYVGEVNDKVLESNPYYKQGDYIGISGLENKYEKDIRGEKGVKIFLVDVHNRIMGSYLNGKSDTLPKIGKNLIITIDANLQEYGERLMTNKIGSIVAIEPKTGEILSMVTSPGYDPNLLIGRIRSKNYTRLKTDSLKPLFNRAVQAAYPPGSIFKIVQAAIGLQEKIISTEGKVYVEPYPNMGDHSPSGYYDVERAIMLSSNWYFAKLYYRMLHRGYSSNRFEDAEIGFNKWRENLLSFGLGNKLGTDIFQELGGNVPSNEFYDKLYGNHSWKASTIISNGIGQGEMLVIPIQMANLTAIIANKGYYYTPHLIKSIGANDSIPEAFVKKKFCNADEKYFDVIHDAMESVISSGTGRRAFLSHIAICGKTGTAENPHGEDHSVFIAFAPKEDPKIAIAVYVENAGFGGTWAGPISSLMIEKYLTDTITNKYKEDRILNANFIDAQ